MKQSDRTDIVQGRTHQYTLDRVYGPTQTTRELYTHSVQNLVHAAMDGYHASVLAYGQTSTGKTHTMSGTPQHPGLIPLAIQDCFQYITQQSEAREYLLRVSYLEVYKEHIRDLLAKSSTPPPVRLFDSKSEGLVIRNIVEEVVSTPEQVFAILARGEARRQVGATNLNLHSSRSHVLVRIFIESKAIMSSTAAQTPRTLTTNTSFHSTNSSVSSELGNNGGSVRVSSLSLVDLAGSESIRLSGTSERREEGHYINQSLMTLGKVVYALSESAATTTTNNNNNNTQRPTSSLRPKHIPYRDSKLTRLLQPSLSGNAQVVLVCCVSPLVSHLEESHNTFKFAIRAKKIPQKATIQETSDDKTLLQSYREEIEELKRQLKDARQQQERLLQQTSAGTDSATASLSLATSMSEVDEDEISELVKSIQTMEKLILKSKPMPSTPRPEDLLDSSEADVSGHEDEADLLALVSGDTPTVSTPRNATPSTPTPRSLTKDFDAVDHTADDDMLRKELSRVQGLLGSVLKKRAHHPGIVRVNSSDDEVHKLRAQLEQQEVASSLRKADASFLQQQLEEKDALLQEVSKILEALEDRQQRLEKENELLRMQLSIYNSNGKS